VTEELSVSLCVFFRAPLQQADEGKTVDGFGRQRKAFEIFMNYNKSNKPE
jgi:hypothetical protein